MRTVHNEPMDEETAQALLSDEGRALLDTVADLAPRMSDLALGTQLRASHPAELVAAAMSQHALRHKAVAKFGEAAARMWFTRDALEQSTRHSVAQHRAQRLAAAGVNSIVDLGCSIGGDLIACAQAGLAVRGVDLDPVRVRLAQANLETLGLAGSVELGDALTTPIGPDEVAFVDPARRDARGRVFSLEGLEPSWDFVSALLAGRAVAKVMPGIAHTDIPPGVEAEWVSDGGALVEASLWGAGFDSTVQRRATVLPSSTTITSRGAAASTGPVQQFLIEPDDAVIRAGLVAEFADDIGGHLLDPKIAWVASNTEPAGDSGFLGAWFRVIAPLPFHTKALKAELQTRDIGTLTVKKRGVDVVPEKLIAQLKLKGNTPGTIVMTRVDNTGAAFLVEPLPHRRHHRA